MNLGGIRLRFWQIKIKRFVLINGIIFSIEDIWSIGFNFVDHIVFAKGESTHDIILYSKEIKFYLFIKFRDSLFAIPFLDLFQFLDIVHMSRCW